MAPVSLEVQVRYLPLILALCHVTAAASLTYTVVSDLLRSNWELSPAQDTRRRGAHRRACLRVFTGLAALSLGLAAYSAVCYATVSYQVWADERGVAVPDGIRHISLRNADGAQSAPLYISFWLTDTALYTDAWEILVEKARRLWWGQQRDLAMVPWAMLLAVEGRRRNIPRMWAYLSLAHLVSLSFAQNLFYLALLLAPSRLPDAHGSFMSRLVNSLFPSKAANWSPNPTLMGAFTALNYAVILYQPYTAASSSFLSVALLGKALSFAPLLAPAVIPESWGSFNTEPHEAYRGLDRLFRLMSLSSLALHGKATLAALLYNLPGSYKHRHSVMVPFDTEKRTALEKTTTAMGRLLGSTSEHPVVAAAGRDVMLCAIGLGLWAAVRGLDPQLMLGVVRPTFSRGHTATETIGTRRSGQRPASRAAKEESSPHAESEHPMTLRRTRHSRFGSVASSNGGDDTNTKPGTATQGPHAPPPTPAMAARRRGRPRKIKTDPEEEPGDKTFTPSPALQAAIVAEQGEGDIVRHMLGDHGDVMGAASDADWESAALVWGLTTLGGLGVGSAAVFGAESVAR